MTAWVLGQRPARHIWGSGARGYLEMTHHTLGVVGQALALLRFPVHGGGCQYFTRSQVQGLFAQLILIVVIVGFR